MSKIIFPTVDSVENFYYNGFFVSSMPGFAKYKVISFLSWTNDAGICRCSCSDNIERLIPTCCLSPEFLKALPEQNLESNKMGGKGVIFGLPSHS